MEQESYILLSVVEDEDGARVCGSTFNKNVAIAWSIGDGHEVYLNPPADKLKVLGYDPIDFSAEETK